MSGEREEVQSRVYQNAEQSGGVLNMSVQPMTASGGGSLKTPLMLPTHGKSIYFMAWMALLHGMDAAETGLSSRRPDFVLAAVPPGAHASVINSCPFSHQEHQEPAV